MKKCRFNFVVRDNAGESVNSIDGESFGIRTEIMANVSDLYGFDLLEDKKNLDLLEDESDFERTEPEDESDFDMLEDGSDSDKTEPEDESDSDRTETEDDIYKIYFDMLEDAISRDIQKQNEIGFDILKDEIDFDILEDDNDSDRTEPDDDEDDKDFDILEDDNDFNMLKDEIDFDILEDDNDSDLLEIDFTKINRPNCCFPDCDVPELDFTRRDNFHYPMIEIDLTKTNHQSSPYPEFDLLELDFQKTKRSRFGDKIEYDIIFNKINSSSYPDEYAIDFDKIKHAGYPGRIGNDNDFDRIGNENDPDMIEDENDTGRIENENEPDENDSPLRKFKHLWVACENCYGVNYKPLFMSRLNICEYCEWHLKMNSSERIQLLLDPDTWDPMNEDMFSVDPIEWHSEEDEDEKPYKDRIDSYQKKTGLTEAVQTGIGQLNGISIAIGIMEFQFMGGSMGSVVGEKITRLIEYATNGSLPLIIVCASGGARMQEGSLSLMQMAKISSASYNYQSIKKLFYISILTSPTTGGVTASFGMLGDIIIAEPNATIAFAGKRVIEETLKTPVPEGSQEAEYLFDKGILDLIVPRNSLKRALSELFQLHGFFPLNQN
uniref:Acetyl-coenzyme A carboxylase carboxyl transferase subunit beta, chloroplastic n=7 Tax=Nigella TaxID=3443 RepID=A0AAU6QA50_9MAGN